MKLERKTARLGWQWKRNWKFSSFWGFCKQKNALLFVVKQRWRFNEIALLINGWRHTQFKRRYFGSKDARRQSCSERMEGGGSVYLCLRHKSLHKSEQTFTCFLQQHVGERWNSWCNKARPIKQRHASDVL